MLADPPRLGPYAGHKGAAVARAAMHIPRYQLTSMSRRRVSSVRRSPRMTRVCRSCRLAWMGHAQAWVSRRNAMRKKGSPCAARSCGQARLRRRLARGGFGDAAAGLPPPGVPQAAGPACPVPGSVRRAGGAGGPGAQPVPFRACVGLRMRLDPRQIGLWVACGCGSTRDAIRLSGFAPSGGFARPIGRDGTCGVAPPGVCAAQRAVSIRRYDTVAPAVHAATEPRSRAKHDGRLGISA